MKPVVAVVFGTRPEAIKMIPVIVALQRDTRITTVTVSTGQHREMLAQVLGRFGVAVNYEMDLMEPNQSLYKLSSKAFIAFESVWTKSTPALVLVQGDTTTAFLGALCAFYSKIPVGHVEAGLRTNDKYFPFPEEINRRLITVVADLYFAPTEGNKRNLQSENISEEKIFVTGNTGIDTLVLASGQDHPFPMPQLDLAPGKRLVTITIHRRESFGDTMRGIFDALRQLALKYPDTEFVYPVHLNPNVRGPAHDSLDGIRNMHLVKPFDYFDFVQMLKRSYLVLSDSGGIQEEAPTLGVPVCVLRNETERPEAVKAGTVRLVGTDPTTIVKEASRILDDPTEHHRLASATNPYGDGHAAQRIVSHLVEFLNI